MSFMTFCQELLDALALEECYPKRNYENLIQIPKDVIMKKY